uniref:Uncharacterized protein n=1 Tax=Oryza rufipogon TaxID=4529 RepID=A0A0E0NDB8_ORYRU
MATLLSEQGVESVTKLASAVELSWTSALLPSQDMMVIAEIYMRCAVRFLVSIRAAASTRVLANRLGQSRNLSTTSDMLGKGGEVDRRGGTAGKATQVESTSGATEVLAKQAGSGGGENMSVQW